MTTVSVSKSWSTNESPLRSTDLNQNFSDLVTFLNGANLDSTNIKLLGITNALVSTTAAIAVTKLAAGTSAQFLANVSTTPTWVDSAGDVTFTTSGTTATFAIGSGKVTSTMILDGTILNADINASAAIAYSKLALTGSILNADISSSAVIAVNKLAAGTSAQVLLNTSTPTPTWTTLAGDVTVGATGTTAIGADKVLASMMANGVVKHRQGGTTGDDSWASPGASNTATDAKAVKIQVGASAGDLSADKAVTFPEAFSQIPVVVATKAATGTASSIYASVQDLTTSGFTFNALTDAGVRSAQNVCWIAIGQ